MPLIFQPTGQGYLLRLTVVPGARRTEVVGSVRRPPQGAGGRGSG